MSQSEEQRIFIKFCVKNGKTPTETFRLLRETFKDEAKSKTQVFDWHRRFKLGRTSTASDKRSGRPRTAYIEKKIKKIQELAVDVNKPVREIAKEVGVSYGSCQRILSDLGLRRLKNNKQRKEVKESLNESKTVETKSSKVKQIPFQHFMADLVESNED